MAADAWSALAAWITVFLGVGALIFAYFQVRDARTLREEQAAPYVVAYMEVTTRTFGVIDFVIKNLGATGAHDISVRFSPEPIKTLNGAVVPFKYPKSIPFLAPGQEWRAAWDYGPRRHDLGLHEPYEVVIDFKDSKKRKQDATESKLDWALIWDQVAPNPKTMKHLVTEVKALREAISKHGRNSVG